jgi:ATP adenylyltransferase
MKQLWSPWRSQYIESLQRPSNECEFCSINKCNDDEQTYVILRKQYNFIVMNLYPYNSGHLLVVPYQHVSDTILLSEAALGEAIMLIQYCLKALRNTCNAEGFNVGLNIGTAAGAGIADHVHFHIVPRWIGDTNFLPVLGETKVISQDIKKMYFTLKSELEKIVP